MAYHDLDVKELSDHVFLKPDVEQGQPFYNRVPQVDHQACARSGRCAPSCRFGAIPNLPDRTIVFADLCRSCGGCVLACPAEAIQEVQLPIGELRLGDSGGVLFCEGKLYVGEAMSPPAISAVKRAAPPAALCIWPRNSISSSNC